MKEIRIIFIGESGSGKSALCTSLGIDGCESNAGAESVTRSIKLISTIGDKYTMDSVDTPGLNDIHLDEDKIRQLLKKAMVWVSPGPHAIVYCVAMNNLTTDVPKTLKFYKDFFGADMGENTIVVFTMLDQWVADRKKQWKTTNPNDFIVEDLPHEMREFLKECHYRYHFFSKDKDNGMAFHIITGMANSLVYTSELCRKIERAIDEKIRKTEKEKRLLLIKESIGVILGKI